MADQADNESIEGRLCGELAAAIARYVTQSDKEWGAGRQGAEFYHSSQSAFESATLTLTWLEVLEPRPHKKTPDETWFCRHALTMDADDMPDFLATRVAQEYEHLPELLECFVAIACIYDCLSDERTLFAPPTQYCKAMTFLARTGYAQQVDSKFRWTDKIGDAMRENYCWDERLRSNRTLERNKIEADAELAWRTMPEDIRRDYLSQPPANRYGVAWILKCCWKDERWQPLSQQEGDFHPTEDDVELARLVVEFAEDRL